MRMRSPTPNRTTELPLHWRTQDGRRVARISDCPVATLTPRADGRVDLSLHALPGIPASTQVVDAGRADATVLAHVSQGAWNAIDGFYTPLRALDYQRDDTVSFVDEAGQVREGIVLASFVPRFGDTACVVRTKRSKAIAIRQARDLTLVKRPGED